MGAVSSLFVRKVIAAASETADKPSLLKSFGLDPEDGIDMAVMVDNEQYYALLEHLAECDRNGVRFQLKAGASMRCDDYSAFGLAWKSAPSIRSSWERAERFGKFLQNVAPYRVETHDDGAWFTMVRKGERRGLQLSNEATLASVLSICREVSDANWMPSAINYQHAPFQDVKVYEDHFRCPVTFNAPRNGIFLTNDILDAPTRLGDEGLSRFFLAHLETELTKVMAVQAAVEGNLKDRSNEHSLAQRVQTEISRSLSEGIPKMENVALELGLSARSLHRRLSDEGVSFNSLVEKSRQRVAQELLKDPTYSLAEIAFLTGFSEQSAFSRAFKRWVGQTPAAFRKQSLIPA